MLGSMGDILGFVSAIAQSPLALIVLALVLIIDGFFPLVPGETTVVVLATLGSAGLGPPLWLVLLVAIAATVVGDGIAFAIGRRAGLERWAWMRRPRIRSALAWAAASIERRAATALITAKFVPFARVAITMTAGAGALPISRYLPISIAASAIYTGYHVVIATIAGSFLRDNPLLAVLLSVGSVLAIGGIVELCRTGYRRRKATVSTDRWRSADR